MPRRAIRIGNCSGAINDGIDQVYRLAKSGEVDAITADYLAEFNIAWRAIELQSNSELGYEPGFLDQLAWENGDAARLVAKKGIKIVHDGGALNPRGLAERVDSYFKSLGLEGVRVAWVEGDDLTGQLKAGSLGEIRHLDKPGASLSAADGEILAANAYTGMAGIVKALDNGAQIVVCGRCTDASPVMGLAYWWHGWKWTDYDRLAGSLMAAHLIECGPYVTGGNYCGQAEIPSMLEVGFPIAEISSNGTTVITKPDGTNGAVTVDTCKSQLLYEIQGSIYLNPDVVANIENVRLDAIGKDRVKLSGVKGMQPPPSTKLAVCLLGGYQVELSGYAAGEDTDFKFEIFKSQVMNRLNPADYSVISIEKYGTAKPNPRSQKEATVQFRSFVQAKEKEALGKFKRALFYNGLQGYCGLHLAMDWRTMEPRPFVKYYPALIQQSRIPLSIHFVGSAERMEVPARPPDTCSASVPLQRTCEPKVPLTLLQDQGETVVGPFGDVVFARSGDKGGNANVGFWVRSPEGWPWLQSFLSSPRLIELLADDWSDDYTVERCEFKHLHAVHFVAKGILQDGVSSSSVLDGFAKSFGEFLRARHVELPERLLKDETKRRKLRQANAAKARSKL